MATQTNNLKLNKVEYADAIRSSITAYNDNFDTLDQNITAFRSEYNSNIEGIQADLSQKANSSDLNGLATERYVLEKINDLEIPEDLSDYATKDDIDNAIGDALQEVY